MRPLTQRRRALLIDWGGTLCAENLPPLSSEVAVARLDRLIERFPGMTAESGRDAVEALADAANSASFTNSDAPIEECAKALGLDLATVRSCMHIPAVDICVLFPGAAALLGEAKSFGLMRVVVTNTSWHTRDACRRDFVDIGVDVDDVVTSVDVQSRKPNAKIFEAALALAQCSAESAIYIGNDEVRDIIPAREMGMRTIRVAIEEAKPNSSVADTVASSLDEARMCLRQWLGA